MPESIEMKKIANLFCRALFVLVSSTALADSIEMLEGKADANAYVSALEKQGEWMQRAFNVCAGRESCRSPLQLQFRVTPEGKVSRCDLIKSDITHTDTANLFCLVVKK